MEASENYPKVVYKYRNWNDKYHQDLLYENHLYLSSPKDFNDPFDCRIPVCFDLLDTQEKLMEYAKKKVDQQAKRLIKMGRDLNQELKIVLNKLSDLKKLQEEHSQLLFESQEKHFGILSLSKRWDSILMWSHYANNHTGFCVGFWEEKLRTSGLIGGGGPVLYNPKDEFPLLDPFQDNEHKTMYERLHHKAFDWGYEEEYRLTKIFYPNKPTEIERIVKVPDNFFAEIIIGIKTPKNIEDEIKRIGKEKNINVLKAIPVPFKFKIEKKELQK
jgi:hypothetical protein